MSEDEQKTENEDGFTEFVELVTSKCKAFFYDQFGTPFVVISQNDTDEAIPIRAKRFHIWLSKLHYDERQIIPATEKLKGVQNILEARAFFDGSERILANRVGWLEGKLYYDLTDGQNRAVKVYPGYWDVTQAPLMFRRYTHQKAQIIPDINASKDDLELLRPFIAVKDTDWPLFKIWLVSAFVPDIPHPCSCPYGDQGSAKSFTSRICKKVVDPSLLEITAIPRDRGDLLLKLQHHWAIFFDNVTYISQDTSDVLCRAISGTAQSKRQLYTDEDDIIFQFQRVLSLNGINIVPQQPDLLDRAILFEFERIPRNKRRTEADLLASFETVFPKILGAIFATLSKALELRPSISLSEMPRMADFALWGEAISRAMGYPQGQFMTLYNQNIGRQNTEAIGASVLGESLLALMADRQDWEGSPTELLNALEERAADLHINTRSVAWPKAPNALTRRLNDIKVNMTEIGLNVERSKSGDRKINITWKIPSKSSEQSNIIESPITSKISDFSQGDIQDDTLKEVSNTVQNDLDDIQKYRPDTVQTNSESNHTLNPKILDSGRLDGMDDTIHGDGIHHHRGCRNPDVKAMNPEKPDFLYCFNCGADSNNKPHVEDGE